MKGENLPCARALSFTESSLGCVKVRPPAPTNGAAPLRAEVKSVPETENFYITAPARSPLGEVTLRGRAVGTKIGRRKSCAALQKETTTSGTRHLKYNGKNVVTLDWS